MLASSSLLRKHAHGSDHSLGTMAFVLVISTVVVSNNEPKMHKSRSHKMTIRPIRPSTTYKNIDEDIVAPQDDDSRDARLLLPDSLPDPSTDTVFDIAAYNSYVV